MIKGINRNMIELTDVSSPYYEKAFLIVRPEYADYQDRLLQREAHRLLRNVGAPSSIKKKGTFYWFLRLGAAAVVGAGLASAVILTQCGI